MQLEVEKKQISKNERPNDLFPSTQEWVIDNGGFAINGGTLTETKKRSDFTASVYAVSRERIASFELDFVNPPQGGRGEHHMSFWITDDKPSGKANGYVAVLYWDGVNWGKTSKEYLDLIRVDNGVHTVIMSGAKSPIQRNSDKNKIKLSVLAGVISIELNGEEKIVTEDKTYKDFNRVTISSYMKYYDTDARFSDVIIAPLLRRNL